MLRIASEYFNAFSTELILLGKAIPCLRDSQYSIDPVSCRKRTRKVVERIETYSRDY